jgi:hypothetical protein
LVTDRKQWKVLVRQAKAHGGLQCQWKKKKNVVILKTEAACSQKMSVSAYKAARCKHPKHQYVNMFFTIIKQTVKIIFK